MLRSAHRQSAFTLIELLTVVTVIGVLAAFLVPAVGSARRQAHAAKCAANLRQIGTAILGYASENNGRLPEVAHVGQAGQEQVSWIRSLRPWLGGSDSVRICPADERAADLVGLPDVTSYVLNDFVFTYPGDGDDGFGGVGAPTALARLDRIRQPTRTLLATVINDSIWPRTLTSDHLHGAGWVTWGAVIGDVSPDIHRPGGRAPQRDAGRSNYLYADGHVSSIAAADLRRRIAAGENPARPPL